MTQSKPSHILPNPSLPINTGVMDSNLTAKLDLTSLLNDGRHFSERRGGLIHIVDSLSGKTVAAFPADGNLPAVLYPTNLDDGTIVYTPQGPPLVSGGYKEITHNPVIVDLICQKITEGASLTEICKNPDMPSYNVLCAWRRKHPYIDEALQRAREDRAEVHRDKALREAENAESRDPLGASALRVDTHKWAAGIDNSKYNPKSKIEATINNPTQIIISTGIDRTPIKDVGNDKGS